MAQRTKTEVVTEVNQITGEVLSIKETSFKVKVSNERYCKLYFDNFEIYEKVGAKAQVLMRFLFKHMNYENEVALTSKKKDEVFEFMKINEGYYRKLIHELKKNKVIVSLFPNYYMVNPYLAVKCKEGVAKKLKEEFDKKLKKIDIIHEIT